MTLNSTAVISTVMAVPLAAMALQLDGGLLPLMISSGIALVAMVTGLVAFRMTVARKAGALVMGRGLTTDDVIPASCILADADTGSASTNRDHSCR